MRRTGDWRQLTRALGKLTRLDTQAIGQEIGEALLTSTKRRFKEGKGPDGTAWPQSIRAKEQGGQTLIDRRRLERSLTYRVQPGRVDIGTNDKRAGIHQRGGTIKAKRAKALKFRVGKRWAVVKAVKMPPRPFVGLSKADEETIRQIIHDAVEGSVR